MAMLKLTQQENLRLTLDIKANGIFIVLAAQSDPAPLKRAVPEISGSFGNQDRQTQAVACLQVTQGA